MQIPFFCFVRFEKILHLEIPDAVFCVLINCICPSTSFGIQAGFRACSQLGQGTEVREFCELSS